MSLPTYQKVLLDGMDRALAARDPRLASMFAIFTRLTRDDGPPRTERLTRDRQAAAARFRKLARRGRASAAIPIVLVACLMAAIIALGIATSAGSVCRPAATAHQVGPVRGSTCTSAAKGT